MLAVSSNISIRQNQIDTVLGSFGAGLRCRLASAGGGVYLPHFVVVPYRVGATRGVSRCTKSTGLGPVLPRWGSLYKCPLPCVPDDSGAQFFASVRVVWMGAQKCFFWGRSWVSDVNTLALIVNH